MSSPVACLSPLHQEWNLSLWGPGLSTRVLGELEASDQSDEHNLFGVFLARHLCSSI